MIAIPNMEKPKTCAECFRVLKCKAVPRWVTTDDSIPKGCPLIEIDDELMIIQLKPTYEATILAVNTIRSFLESGHYGESYWRDENGEGFDADMGYLFDGLKEIKKYCEERATE